MAPLPRLPQIILVIGQRLPAVTGRGREPNYYPSSCGGVTSDTDRWIRHRGIYLCENNTKANMIWTHGSVAALQVGEKKGDRQKKKGDSITESDA
jgi:hypothetical protein